MQRTKHTRFAKLPTVPKATSHRQHRMARKLFRRNKQAPSGWHLMYRLKSSVEGTTTPSPKLLAEWKFLDEQALKMFRKVYDKLTRTQKSRLIDSLHKEE